MTLPVRRDVFFDYQQRLIEALLRRPKTQVLVACQYNDADLIFGYLVGEPPRILHWVYVKKPFRNSGIMARLIKAAGYSTTLEDCVFTHLTNSLISLCKAGKIEATFNPYAGYERIEYGP